MSGNIPANNKGVSESEFYMWRAIFALAHADHVVTDEERSFMTKNLAVISFSAEQRDVLTQDIETAQNISDMFLKIEDQEFRSRFFYYARMLMWSDGDFAAQEQKIITELGRAHYKMVDFGKMIEKNQFELEDQEKKWIAEDVSAVRTNKAGLISRFLSRFRPYS